MILVSSILVTLLDAFVAASELESDVKVSYFVVSSLLYLGIVLLLLFIGA